MSCRLSHSGVQIQIYFRPSNKHVADSSRYKGSKHHTVYALYHTVYALYHTILDRYSPNTQQSRHAYTELKNFLHVQHLTQAFLGSFYLNEAQTSHETSVTS